MSQDIENILPKTNIIKDTNNVRVIRKKPVNGFIQTEIESIPIINHFPGNHVSYQINNKHILNTVCLTVEDVKKSSRVEQNNCWKFHNLFYKNVLMYGYVVILNECSRDNNHYYTLHIDDETESIDGYLSKNDRREDPISKINDFHKRKVTLERRKETGINLHGTYFPSDSVECKLALENIAKLQTMIQKNLKSTERNFVLGPLKQKALIHGMPIVRHDTIRLNIFDISLDDGLELIWKRNINALYEEVYFK